MTVLSKRCVAQPQANEQLANVISSKRRRACQFPIDVCRRYEVVLPRRVRGRRFFYDSSIGSAKFAQEDLSKLEAAMKAAAKEAHEFQRLVLSKEDALEMFADNPFKVSFSGSGTLWVANYVSRKFRFSDERRQIFRGSHGHSALFRKSVKI